MTLKAQINAVLGAAPPVRQGAVVRITERSIMVSSSQGLKEFQVDNPGSYNSGDLIKFQGNTYLGRVPSNLTSKTYVV